MRTVKIALHEKNLETTCPPGKVNEIHLEGTMRVIFDEKSSAYRMAFDNFRRDVDPKGDRLDLALYVASFALEGHQPPDMPHVDIRRGRDPMPDAFPWCMVVCPLVTLEAPEQ